MWETAVVLAPQAQAAATGPYTRCAKTTQVHARIRLEYHVKAHTGQTAKDIPESNELE